MKIFLKAKKIKYTLIGILLFSPIFVSAGLVPCGAKINDPATPWNEMDPCGFSHLMIMINGIIYFLLFNVAIPVAAILFAYAGFMFMTAAGNEGKISKAKEIFGAVLYGLLIAFLAWLIVNTVLTALGLNSDYSYLKNP